MVYSFVYPVGSTTARFHCISRINLRISLQRQCCGHWGLHGLGLPRPSSSSLVGFNAQRPPPNPPGLRHPSPAHHWKPCGPTTSWLPSDSTSPHQRCLMTTGGAAEQTPTVLVLTPACCRCRLSLGWLSRPLPRAPALTTSLPEPSCNVLLPHPRVCPRRAAVPIRAGQPGA